MRERFAPEGLEGLDAELGDPVVLDCAPWGPVVLDPPPLLDSAPADDLPTRREDADSSDVAGD